MLNIPFRRFMRTPRPAAFGRPLFQKDDEGVESLTGSNNRFLARLVTSIVTAGDRVEADAALVPLSRLISNAHLTLMYGGLGPLSIYLRALPEVIDTKVAGRLANMIDGPKNRTGHRLRVVNHPDTPAAKRGRKAKSAKNSRFFRCIEPSGRR